MEPSVSEKLVSKIASQKDVDPFHLKPLNDEIDPDALNSLFSDTKSASRVEGAIEFDYEGYHVTVSAEDEITLTKVKEREEVEVQDETATQSGTLD